MEPQCNENIVNHCHNHGNNMFSYGKAHVLKKKNIIVDHFTAEAAILLKATM